MLVATWVASGSLYAQSSSTIGTDFWLGFMPNQAGASDRVLLVASSLTPTTITVETYLGDSISIKTEVFSVKPSNFGDTIGTTTIELDPDFAEVRSYETPVYRSIHVSSDAPISLSAYTYKRGSGEGMLVLPITTYGKEYRTLNYPTYRAGKDVYSGEFLIVSPFEDNLVTIESNAYTENGYGVESHVPGSSWQVKLRKGQSYLVRSSTKVGTNATDLTGSRITSKQPIAVISGHQYTKLDAPYGSTFFEMLPPVESWSRRYHYANFDPERRSTIVIVAADTGEFYLTTESVSTPITLFPGQRYEEEVLFNEALYAVSSTNSRFIAYELRRSKDISTDIKNYPPSMTILTSPDDRDNTFIQNYPPLFDSLSMDVAEQSIFYGHVDNITELFPNAKYPELHFIPRTNLNYGYKTSSGYANAHARSFFNRVPVSSLLNGTNGTASFGHSGSLRYTKRSPDMKPPYVTVNSSYCGSYDITITDDVVTNPQTVESGKLASVRVILSEHDITQLPPMRNYRILRSNDFTMCSQSDRFKLEVINPQLDAYAAVYVQDLAGNDTQYVFTYKAGTTPLSLAKGNGNKIPVNEDVCWTMDLYPKGDTASAFVMIESLRLKNGLSNLTIRSITPSLPHVFNVGDTLHVAVCANLADTASVIMDSLLVFADCYERSYPVSAKGATALLYATDASICDNKYPNTTYSTTISLQNKGELPLSVTGFTVVGNNFWIDPTWKLPQGIAKNSYYGVTIFYRPTQYNASDTAMVYWQTNVNAPYTNSIKTVSLLTGCTMPLSGVTNEVNSSLDVRSLTPNPAKDFIEIRYYSSSKVTVTVVNELGAEALKFELMPSEGPESSTRINLPQLANGSYTLRLQNSGGEVVSRRFVVAR